MGDISAEFISFTVKQEKKKRVFGFHPVTIGPGKRPVVRHNVRGNNNG